SRQARVRGAAGAPLEQARQPQERPRRNRHGSRIDDADHALAGEHEAGAAETDEMRGSGDHKRQPQCSATMPPVICRYETRWKPAARSMAAKASGLGKRRIDSTR